MCQVNNDNTVSLYHFYNNETISSSLLLSTNPTIGFTNIVTSYKNGVATCSFTRAVKMSDITYYFDLRKSYYILAAYGPLKSDLPSFHTFYQSSSSMFNFQNVSFINLTTTPISVTTSAAKNIGIYQAGAITLNWIMNTDSTTNITMYSKLSQNNWFAFGLSTDNHMVKKNFDMFMGIFKMRIINPLLFCILRLLCLKIIKI